MCILIFIFALKCMSSCVYILMFNTFVNCRWKLKGVKCLYFVMYWASILLINSNIFYCSVFFPNLNHHRITLYITPCSKYHILHFSFKVLFVMYKWIHFSICLHSQGKCTGSLILTVRFIVHLQDEFTGSLMIYQSSSLLSLPPTKNKN